LWITLWRVGERGYNFLIMNTASGSGGRQRPSWRSELHGFWRWVGIALTVLLVAYIALVIYRIPAVREKERSAEAVAAIQTQRLTMNDVDGEHLPPPPDPAQVNATVAGVDVNGNGIRDDVELAIFAKYPGEANKKIRAAELQYAMELQQELNGSVFDTQTWKANAKVEGRGYGCVSLTVPRDDIQLHVNTVSKLTSDVEALVFNTAARKTAQSDINKYETSFGLPNSNLCDVPI
jgi:hypothetical protein